MSKFISNKVKVLNFHTAKRFIDDPGTLNDGGVFNNVNKYIYPPELQLKVKHSGTHATFFNLDIAVNDGLSVYNFLISVMLL